MTDHTDMLHRFDTIVAEVRTALAGAAPPVLTPAPVVDAPAALVIEMSARVHGDPPHAEVFVDSVTAGKWDVKADHTKGKTETIKVPGMFTGAKAVEVRFSQSKPDAAGKLSALFVHDVTLNGKRIAGNKGNNNTSANWDGEELNGAVMVVPGRVIYSFANRGGTTQPAPATPVPTPAPTPAPTPSTDTRPAPNETFVIAGDSIGLGTTTGADPWAHYGIDGKPLTIINVSHGGQYLGQHSYTARAELMKHKGPGRWLIIQAATNDLRGGKAEDVYLSVPSLTEEWQKAGGYVLVATVLPRADKDWTAEDEVQRGAYNGLVKANAAGADVINDIASIPQMQAVNDVYVYSDKLHPRSEAYDQFVKPTYEAAIVNFQAGLAR